MASLQSLSGLRTMRSNESEKGAKSRGLIVKPILKKLSQSEKSSIDLDRGLDEQEDSYRSPNGWGGGLSSFYESSAAGRNGSSKDVSFAFSPAEPPSASGRRYHHARSISGASHISVATSGSGNGVAGSRTGFVHPFQQTPRAATPPLSYANSFASLADAREAHGSNRDYSPTITEDEDNVFYNSSGYNYDQDPSGSHHSLSQTQTLANSNPPSYSQPSLGNSNQASNLRRPSLASQRTSSFSDSSNKPRPPLRINTAPRSMSSTRGQSSKLVHVSSQSELQAHLADESIGAHAASYHQRHMASPTSPVTSMSPFSRSSLEIVGFPRLRAKSDLDTSTRAEQVKEARRKILAKEHAKEEKHAREEIKQREKADNKRAQELERRAAAERKERDAARRREEMAALAEAMPRDSKHNRKLSMTSSGRPSLSHRRPTVELPSEKRFISGHYDAMETRNPPSFGDEAGRARNVSFQSTKRTNTAKRKTHSAWTVFILWFRTRLLRMGNREH
ncbi:hypothetical protein BX600DRAFT_34337 [Xylariales sp. PMI_506]|nr:hypothetical protein BX600DRAFT_34337 [Xylariales sp. PMI_506]